MVFNGPSSPASSESDTESGGKSSMLELKSKVKSLLNNKIERKAVRSHLGRQKLMLELKLKVQSRLNDKIRRKAMRVLSPLHVGVDSVCIDGKEGTLMLVGPINPVEVVFELRKICVIHIMSVAILTARNDAFPTTVRITELQSTEDTDQGRKRSLGIQLSGEQPEQSEKRQEDRPSSGQAVSYITQEKVSLLPHRLPSLSLPLASKAQPSPSPVSRSSQGTSNQIQAAPDHVPELSFPFAPSPLHNFQTESLADKPSQSSISGGVCHAKSMNLMKENGLGGHDQLYDSAVHHLLSSINGIVKLKRCYDLHAGEQAGHLKEATDTAILLRKQVEELEAELSMAKTLESCLRDMLSISEDTHARTKRELALMQEKMDEANRRIEYLENEKADEKSRGLFRLSTPHPSPATPRSTSPSFVPSPSPVLADLEMCNESALFPELTSYLDNLIMRS